MTMPVLFIGHGSPMTIEQPQRLAEWQAWGASLPRPRAVLMISAHWETRPLMLGATSTQPLIYDFYGFPESYYQLSYPAPGASELARRVGELLQEAGVAYGERPERGWDHGVWIPMLGLYPEADVPLLQISLPSQDPAALMQLGATLAPLREEGVLIITSGLLTHNLRQWTPDGVVAPWARAFDEWLAERLLARDWPALCDWPSAPGAQESVPTADHLMPLFVAMGASQPGEALSFPVTGFEFGSFSHRSVQFGTSTNGR